MVTLGSVLINGLVFKRVFAFNKHEFEVINEDIFNAIGGVYAVYIKNNLVYIGSFSNTLQQRWINKKLDKFIHFKADILKEMAEDTLVQVYVLTRDSIREQLFDSEYINHESVESRLVEVMDPPLNIVKKNDKNKSSKS